MYELKIYRGVMFHDNEEWCKFEEESTYRFIIDEKSLTNFDPSTQNSQNFALQLAPFGQSKCFSLKSTEKLRLMTLMIDAKFEGKLTCTFKNDMSIFVNFHRLKNSILENKMAEPNKNKHSSNQID